MSKQYQNQMKKQYDKGVSDERMRIEEIIENCRKGLLTNVQTNILKMKIEGENK